MSSTFVRKWKANMFLVGAQEMLHLAQVGNLSLAIGGALHLSRPNFPQRPEYYPTKLPWGLFPFSPNAIRLYALYERPSRMSEEAKRLVEAGPAGAAREADLYHEDRKEWAKKLPFAHLPAHLGELKPSATRAETIGELYAAIRAAYETLTPPSGELVIGAPDRQINGQLIDFPQVIEVNERVAAAGAIDLIIHQGEGAPADRIDSHFGVYVNILREYEALVAKNPSFAPARDVHPNPLSRLHVDNTYPGFRLIFDDYTRDVNDLCSGVYQTMIVMLYRLFGTPRRAAQEQKVLARSALRLMTTVIKPFGEALTRLPMGDDHTPGSPRRARFAGPSFEIDRAISLVPDPRASWIDIYERLVDLATRTGALADAPAARSAAHEVSIRYLRNAAAILADIAASFGPDLPSPRDPHRS